jgi:hypothetical protein
MIIWVLHYDELYYRPVPKDLKFTRLYKGFSAVFMLCRSLKAH